MTAPHEPSDEGEDASAQLGRAPKLSVVHGDFEALLRRLLRLMTRETTPELKQLMERLSYRAPLRGVVDRDIGTLLPTSWQPSV